MTSGEIKSRLEWLANAKEGDPLPDWLPSVGYAGPLSQLAKETLNLIKHLEKAFD